MDEKNIQERWQNGKAVKSKFHIALLVSDIGWTISKTNFKWNK